MTKILAAAIFSVFLLWSPVKAEDMYVLTLEVYSSDFTLNPLTHIKNRMNTAVFSIPTTREFFDSVKEGQELMDDFKVGTFLLKMSVSNFVVKVKQKEIVTSLPKPGDS